MLVKLVHVAFFCEQDTGLLNDVGEDVGHSFTYAMFLEY